MERGPAALQQPYIRVVSLKEEEGDSHSRFNFTYVAATVMQEQSFTLLGDGTQSSAHDVKCTSC
jgi:hypothetical protein